MRALAILIALGASARAETWPTLEQYVSWCTLIVKAETVMEGKQPTFRVVESWRGSYDPKKFTKTTKDGRFFADQGKYGVAVAHGQEIVFFFTPDNQPVKDKFSFHSTSFPIRDGIVVYGDTSDKPRRFKVAEFKRAIQQVR